MSELEASPRTDAAPAAAPSPWKKRAVIASVVLLAAGAVAGGAFVWWRSQEAPPLVDVFPDESYLVAFVDVEALRKGPLADLVSEGDSQAKQQAKSLLGTCSDGAIAAVREVGIVVPGGASEEGSFALAARLDTKGSWLAACDAELSAKGDAMPRETGGAWTYIGKNDAPRLALHRGGLVLWGREPFLHALAASALKKDGAHVYRQFASRIGEAAQSPHALAAITLPAEQRRVFAAVIEEQQHEDGHPELFSIARAGLAATVDAPADTLHVSARFESDNLDAVPKLRALFEKLVQKAGDSLEVRAIGLGDALSGARVVAAGDAVVVTTSAPLARLRMMARRLRLMNEMRKLTRDANPASPDPTPAQPAP